MNLKTIPFRLSFPHSNTGILKYGKLKDCQTKNTTVYHTAYGKRWLFALRAALLQISVSQTNGATRNNYATGLGCVRTSLFARFGHANYGREVQIPLPQPKKI